MRVVRVFVSRASFADTLGAMRAWLDRHNRPLVRFETATEDDTIIMTVHFDEDALGDEFRQDFGGADPG